MERNHKVLLRQAVKPHTLSALPHKCVLLALATIMASCGDQTPGSGSTSADVPTMKAPASSTPFTAKVSCPIPVRDKPTPTASITVWPVGPTPCDESTLGEACRLVAMTQLQCSWDGLTLGGQAVTTSMWHGQGYLQGSTGAVTTGYDWGTAANGASYLSRWTETITPEKITAKWTLVLGTGTLTGIAGQAAIDCAPPKSGDTVEVCSVTGSYSLPK
jgi:hypothetical protein